MTPEKLEYIKAEGLSSTLLGNFADDPIFATRKSEPQTYFQDGKAYERIFEDTVKGTDIFAEKFFICPDMKIPDSFINVYYSDKPITSHFVFTKKGELNKKNEALHDVLFECLMDQMYFSGGKKRYPIPISDYNIMKLGVERALNTTIELFPGEEYLVKDLLDERCKFQVPLYWEYAGIKKKALLDILAFFERNGYTYTLAIDLKYIQNLGAMNMFFRNTKSKYTIQSTHYTEALIFQEQFEHLKKYPQMPFLISTKSDPYFTQAFMINEQSLEYCGDDYYQLCIDCDNWLKAGKPVSGIKKTKHVRIWRN